jgi:hypothetical protein
MRTRLLDGRPSLQTAAPGERRVDIEPVKPAELAAAIAVLRRVRPLTLAS